ncbi:copper chaperone PCu(A)C [Bisgaard Taxon 46]
MKSSTKFLFALISLLSFNVFAKINVDQAFVFSAKAGEPTAVFMNIYNTGQEDVNLAMVQSDVNANLALHGTQNGKMIEVTGIAIPAHKMTSLKRGGLHIMVFDVEQELEVGKTFPLSLLFDNGEIIKINAKIIQYQ